MRRADARRPSALRCLLAPGGGIAPIQPAGYQPTSSTLEHYPAWLRKKESNLLKWAYETRWRSDAFRIAQCEYSTTTIRRQGGRPSRSDGNVMWSCSMPGGPILCSRRAFGYLSALLTTLGPSRSPRGRGSMRSHDGPVLLPGFMPRRGSCATCSEIGRPAGSCRRRIIVLQYGGGAKPGPSRTRETFISRSGRPWRGPCPLRGGPPYPTRRRVGWIHASFVRPSAAGEPSSSLAEVHTVRG